MASKTLMVHPDYKTLNPVAVVHPGEVLSEYLDSNCWNQRDLARRTGITPKTVSQICNGKAPISPLASLALEKVFRRPAHFWLNLQRQHDELLARNKYEESRKSWVQWSSRFPIQDLKKLNLLPEGGSRLDDLDALLFFLGVSSPENWKKVWKASRIAFRQTRQVKASTEAISSWVRATEFYSEAIRTSEYDAQGVLNAIKPLRECTARKAEKSIPDAQSICASVGIAFVLVPGFSNTGISGCARWLSPAKALIALSNRHQSDDRLWFAFFHELAHILMHRKTHAFVLDNAVDDLSDKVVDPTIQKHEDEANRFAADTLIPPDELAVFIGEAKFTNESIREFSRHVGVGPGLVVGRLQHEGLLQPHQGNRLKQKIELHVA